MTYPTINSGQNGPGSADTETTFFDLYGFPIWHKDGDGFLHYTAYDLATGAVGKAIADVDSTQPAPSPASRAAGPRLRAAACT